MDLMPICPYCNYKYNNMDMMNTEQVEEQTVICPHCKKMFKLKQYEVYDSEELEEGNK